MNDACKNWLGQISWVRLRDIAEDAIERLMELGEVGFHIDDVVDPHGEAISSEASLDEGLYWKESGDDLGSIKRM